MKYKDDNFLKAVLILSGLASAFTLYTMYAYGFDAVYRDHSEPGVAFRAWVLVRDGAELVYPARESVYHLTNAYGPLTYIIIGSAQALFGASILTGKLPIFVSVVLTIIFTGLYIYRRYGPAYTPFAVLIMNGFILFSAPAYLVVKNDSLILMLVAFALLATTFDKANRRPWLVPLLIALTVGLSVNLKIYSFIFFVPITIFYCRQRWMAVWPAMALVSIAVFAIPFVFFSFSFSNYFNGLLALSAVRDIDLSLLPLSLRYSSVFLVALLPLAVSTYLGRIQREDLFYFGLFAVFYGVSMYSTLIAGRLKFDIFFFPVALDLLIRMIRTLEPHRKIQRSFIALLSVSFIVLAVTPQKRFFRALASDQWQLSVTKEVETIIQEFPTQTIEMGYGSDIIDTYRMSFAKPLLAFAGNSMIVDGHMDIEHQFADIPMNAAKLNHVRNCETDLWLIPKGESPFTLESYYRDKPRSVYPESFRVAFIEAYKIKETKRFFDIWDCR